MEALLLPAPSPGLLGSSSSVCLTKRPAVRFVLGTKRGKKPRFCSQAGRTDRNGRSRGPFTQASGASSGPTVNLRESGLLGYYGHIFIRQETKAPKGKAVDNRGPSLRGISSRRFHSTSVFLSRRPSPPLASFPHNLSQVSEGPVSGLPNVYPGT